MAVLRKEEVMSDNDHHKDSCEYAVGIANQFLTLATAGLAFVVALALASDTPLTPLWYWCGGLLAFSVLAGLLFTMSVVAHINQEAKYDVYNGMLKTFSLAQILSFLCAIIVLAIIVVGLIPKGAATKTSDLTIKAGDKEIHQIVPDNSSLSVNISTGNLIQIEMKPK